MSHAFKRPTSAQSSATAPRMAIVTLLGALALSATTATTAAPPPAQELRISQTAYFSFALPPGWRVGEDGQFALTLVAPDRQAMTVLVGNSGLQPQYPPMRFAWEKLSALRPQNLQFGQAKQVQAAAGFAQAMAFEVSYGMNGQVWRGVARVSVAPAYDSATMALSGAFATAEQWPGHAPWLPQVALQVAATNGGAFGQRGIMAQNLRNSTAYAEAARDYRQWSQQNWQQVVDQRNASQDRRNFAVRENLGGVQAFADPYGNTQPRELPTGHKYYWADRQGRIWGSNDPSADPNAGGTGEWRRMERVQR